MKPKSYLMLGLLAALWGASFLFMRVGAPALGPIFLIELRVLIAGIALLVIALLRKHPIRLLHKWKHYLLLGALNAAIPFLLIATAELHLSASLAAILNAMTPLFTALVAWGWMKESFTWKKFLGLVVGIFGVTVLVGWDSNHNGDQLVVSILFSLLAALFYGIGGVFSSRTFKGESSMDMAIGQQLAAALLLLPVSAFALPSAMPSTEVVVSVLALAIFCTAFGYMLYFALIQQVGPVRTLTVTFLIPIFGILWGVLFLGEAVTGGVAAGLLLILLSVALVVKK
ncbi:DMT family transporter [Tumebacillus permanentifrigoris]|uniref:Threonine/homoserine efflux transporter RhtA n=1 Tax=Tumebacillus permanentifrigoris TaxID=378543 RepID=A0A316D2F4_9BACL|nr:DMT family transporter [Tumebacillus permanentifrigoris]PWK05054.1 threonine/homoserine efflux transporter RhtA [Tumebacillus permanentifrigoris]